MKDIVKIVEGLRGKVLEDLNEEDPNWIDEAQDRSDDATSAAEKVLAAAGYTREDEDWDELLEELASEVSWIPGHYALTEDANSKAGKGR